MRRLDLNLFRVFEVVMRHRSVSAAGRELGVTASAVSHALARLRRAIGDELFVAGEGGMEPTPRAHELAPDIRDGMARLEAAFNDAAFDLATTTRCFRIAATDYTSAAILPLLVREVTRRAPFASLRIFPANRIDVVAGLEEGWLDILLGWFGEVPGHIHRAAVLTDVETLVARPGHELAGRRVSLAELLAFPQLVVELTGGEPQPDEGFINERGVWRRTWIERVVIDQGGASVGAVAVTVPHYAAVAPMLRATDMVATLPRRLAMDAIDQGQLIELDVDSQKLAVEVEALWHDRADRDAGLRWLLATLHSAMASLMVEQSPRRPPPG